MTGDDRSGRSGRPPRLPAGRRSRRALIRAVGVAGAASLAGCSDLVGPGPGADSDPDAPGGGNGGGGGGGGSGGDGTTASSTTAGGDGNGDTTTGSDADGSLAMITDSTIPGTDSTYAMMGRADADETATLYGGWKCPYTRLFVTDMLPDVVTTYVQPGDLAIEYRAVNFQADESYGDDEPAANRAGLAVWNAAPEQFWSYVVTVFTNQPPERDEWATPDRLAGFAERAGVQNPEPVREAAAGTQYQEDWNATQQLIEEKGITGIPRFELGGEITAPTIDPSSTKQQLERVFE